MDQESKKAKTGNSSKAQNDMVVKELNTRGVQKYEFERYLTKNAKKILDNVYYGDGWQISLSQERQEKIGSCDIVAVDVTLSVKAEIFEAFLLSFRKNFLRGGG